MHRPTTRTRGLALLAMATLALGACGLPEDSQPQEISRDSLPKTLIESPGSVTVVEPSERSTNQTIFLVRSQGTTDGLVAVNVALPAPNNGGDLPRAVLERLISNPPTPETADLSSAIPPGVRIRSAVINGDVLDLDLANLGTIESTRQRLAVAQFVYTATAIPGIRGVRFAIDGEPSGIPLDDRTADPGAVIGRSDFPKLNAVTSATPGAPTPSSSATETTESLTP